MRQGRNILRDIDWDFEQALDELEDPGCLCWDDDTDPDCPYHGLAAQREELERAGQRRL